MDSAVTFIDSFAEIPVLPTEVSAATGSINEVAQVELKRCCNCECSLSGKSDVKLRNHILKCRPCEPAVFQDYNDVKLCCNCERPVSGRDTTLRNHILACIRPIQSVGRQSNGQGCRKSVSGEPADKAVRTTKAVAEVRPAVSGTRKCTKCERIIRGLSNFLRHIAVCDGSTKEEQDRLRHQRASLAKRKTSVDLQSSRNDHSYFQDQDESAIASIAKRAKVAETSAEPHSSMDERLSFRAAAAAAEARKEQEWLRHQKATLAKRQTSAELQSLRNDHSYEQDQRASGRRHRAIVAKSSKAVETVVEPQSSLDEHLSVPVATPIEEAITTPKVNSSFSNHCNKCDRTIGGGRGNFIKHLTCCLGVSTPRAREERVQPPQSSSSSASAACNRCGLNIAGGRGNLLRHQNVCDGSGVTNRKKKRHRNEPGPSRVTASSTQCPHCKQQVAGSLLLHMVTCADATGDSSGFDVFAERRQLASSEGRGVSLRSQRMKLPSNFPRKKLAAIEQVLEGLNIEFNPIATEEVVADFVDLRNDILSLYDLKNAMSVCHVELESLKLQHESLTTDSANEITEKLKERTDAAEASFARKRLVDLIDIASDEAQPSAALEMEQQADRVTPDSDEQSCGGSDGPAHEPSSPSLNSVPVSESGEIPLGALAVKIKAAAPLTRQCSSCKRKIGGGIGNYRSHVAVCNGSGRKLRIRVRRKKRWTARNGSCEERLLQEDAENAKNECARCGVKIGGNHGHMVQHLRRCDGSVREKPEPNLAEGLSSDLGDVPLFDDSMTAFAADIIAAPPVPPRRCVRCGLEIRGGLGNFVQHTRVCDGTMKKKKKNSDYDYRRQIEKRRRKLASYRGVLEVTIKQEDSEDDKNQCARCGVKIGGNYGCLVQHLRRCDGSVRVKRERNLTKRDAGKIKQTDDSSVPKSEVANPVSEFGNICYHCGLFFGDGLDAIASHMADCEKISEKDREAYAAKQPEPQHVEAHCPRCGVDIRGGQKKLVQHVLKCDGSQRLRRRILAKRRLRLSRAGGQPTNPRETAPKNEVEKEPASDWKNMCDHCGLFFSGGVANLLKHMALCEKIMAGDVDSPAQRQRPSQVTCRLCGCTFSSATHYTRHLFARRSTCGSLQKPQADPRRPCERCGKVFDRKYALERHMIGCMARNPAAVPKSNCENKRPSSTNGSVASDIAGSSSGMLEALGFIQDTSASSINQAQTEQHGESSNASENGISLDPFDGHAAPIEGGIEMIKDSEGDEDFDGEPPIVSGETDDFKDEAAHLYGCNLCEKTFGRAIALEIHAKYCHVATTDWPSFRCLSCPTTFSDLAKLRGHWITHKPANFACPRCDLTFVNAGRYRDHFGAKHALRFHRCPDCRKQFAFKEDLTEHVLCVHKKKREKIQCPTCPKSFSAKDKFESHVRYHRFPELECEICGKIMGGENQIHFVVHIDRHFGYKRYKCNQCEMTFHAHIQVAKHKRVHTGARPYACDLCPRTFANKSNQVLHKRVHLGLKPYLCEFCGKDFANSSNHKLHVRTQHTEPDCPRPWQKKKSKPAVAAKESRIKRVGGAKKKKKRPKEKYESDDSESEVSLSPSEGEEEEGDEEEDEEQEEEENTESGDEQDSSDLPPIAGIFQGPSTSSKSNKGTKTVVITVPPVVAAHEEVPTTSSSGMVVEALNVANGLVDFWSQMPMFHHGRI